MVAVYEHNGFEFRITKRGEVKEPKCEGCTSGIDRPKCAFELGGACPRHDVLWAYRELKKLVEGHKKAQAEYERRGRINRSLLAGMLESISKGMPALDEDIHRLVSPESYQPLKGTTVVFRPKPPQYTRNLQDAMLLIPEGWSAQCHFHPDLSHVSLYKLGPEVRETDGTGTRWHLSREIIEGVNDEYAGDGFTPPLAMCAAALRIPVDKR